MNRNSLSAFSEKVNKVNVELKNNFNQIDIENVLLAYNDGDLIHGILVNNNYIPLKPQKVIIST